MLITRDVIIFYSSYVCNSVIDHGSTSDYNDENYTINAVYKSIVILPCNLQLRPSTNPVWFKNHLVLDLKVHCIYV